MSLNSVSGKAQIGSNVIIGDFTVINDDVQIGNNVEIGTNVIIADGSRIADGVKIHHGTAIGTIPQDLKFRGEYSTMEIGEGTVVREFSMLNRGTAASGKTIIGKNCLLMAYTHVAHDCVVGNNVIMGNCATLGGHVRIDDWAILEDVTGIHQFCKVGKHSIITSQVLVGKDIPPYIAVGSMPAQFNGVNLAGLRQRNFTDKQIKTITEAYSIIYKSGLNFSDALEKLKVSGDSIQYHTEEIKEIIHFIESSERGILKG